MKSIPSEEGFIEQSENIPFQPGEKKVDWEKMVEQHASQQEFRKEHDPSTKYAKVETPTDKYTMLVLSGDKHIGCSGFDWATFMSDSKTILNNPNIYQIDMGDIVDNLFFSQYEDVFNLNEQIQLVNAWAKEFLDNGKMIATVGGNHCNFLRKLGVEFQMLATGFGGFVPYLREGGYLEWKLGEVTYKFRLDHKTRYNSDLNPHHTNHRTYWMIGSDCDVIASAHSHSNTTEEWATRTSGKDKNTVFVKSGTYKYEDKYKDGNGFMPDWQTGCPYLILNPYNKEIFSGIGVDKGSKLLKRMNSEPIVF